ncbi:hypothetical protein SAMN05421761_10536 [Belliella pelovolcani]|uniref:Uncharacterized protein n=1 Tax=Belliella pelovolcani TaxID=529505 RepID=A0A1N7M2U5_9BACT|nr:hypothetical protein SAMN05421761_10536 [Belliella pelovolcani]
MNPILIDIGSAKADKLLIDIGLKSEVYTTLMFHW